MLRALFNAMLRGARRRALRNGQPRPARFIPSMQMLEAREVPAVVATFVAGILSIFGDALNNTITVSRDAAGTILVNGGAVADPGRHADRRQHGADPGLRPGRQRHHHPRTRRTARCRGRTSSAAPATTRSPAAPATTMLFGQAGNDTLLGKGGSDFLFGGTGNDTLTGGDGDDQVFGEAGNDRMIWNPGDDTDLNEGGAGIDTVEVNGGNGAEAFHRHRQRHPRPVRPRHTRPRFSIDIGTSENLVVNMNGGDDTFSATGNGWPR